MSNFADFALGQFSTSKTGLQNRPDPIQNPTLDSKKCTTKSDKCLLFGRPQKTGPENQLHGPKSDVLGHVHALSWVLSDHLIDFWGPLCGNQNLGFCMGLARVQDWTVLCTTHYKTPAILLKKVIVCTFLILCKYTESPCLAYYINNSLEVLLRNGRALLQSCMK